MLKWIYDSLGFFLTFAISIVIFLLFICYLAGIAGISDLHISEKKKNWLLVASVVILPYPVIWLFMNILQQKKRLTLDARQ